MSREQLSCVRHRAAQLMAAVQKEHGGRHNSKCHESQGLRLLWRHLRRTSSQENRALLGEQEDPSPLQLSAKEQQISKLKNKPPKLGFFCLRVVEEDETSTAQLTAVWISLRKSALMAEKWRSADVAKPFKRLQR